MVCPLNMTAVLSTLAVVKRNDRTLPGANPTHDIYLF